MLGRLRVKITWILSRENGIPVAETAKFLRAGTPNVKLTGAQLSGMCQ